MKDGVILNEVELNTVCKELMNEIWGDSLDIPVVISNRLTSTFGQFTHKKEDIFGKRIPVKISISGRLLKGDYKLSTVESILKHELCHYYLYKKQVMGYKDGDRTFENELRRIGSHSTKVISNCGEVHIIRCSKCNKIVAEIGNKSRYNRIMKNHVSKCCKASLVSNEVRRVEDNIEEVKGVITTNVIERFMRSQSEEIKTIKQTAVTKVNNSSMEIDKIVIPGKRGVLKEQVYQAMISAIKLQEPEKIRLIKEHYEDLFNNVCMNNLSNKRLGYVNECINKVV